MLGRALISTIVLAAALAVPVLAQTAPSVAPAASTIPPAAEVPATAQPVAAPGEVPATTAVPGKGKGAAAAGTGAAKGRECTRLPLSDIQVGKEKTIEVARLRLDEYVAKVGKQKGWNTWDKSQETIACEDYLFVPLLGQEYKCLVTATFCKKS